MDLCPRQNIPASGIFLLPMFPGEIKYLDYEHGQEYFREKKPKTYASYAVCECCAPRAVNKNDRWGGATVEVRRRGSLAPSVASSVSTVTSSVSTVTSSVSTVTRRPKHDRAVSEPPQQVTRKQGKL